MTDGIDGTHSTDGPDGSDGSDGPAGTNGSVVTDEIDGSVVTDEIDDGKTAFEGSHTETSATTDSEDEEERSGNIAGTLDLEEPLEPQEIDLENAIFVALGVLLVVGFLVVAIQGL